MRRVPLPLLLPSGLLLSAFLVASSAALAGPIPAIEIEGGLQPPGSPADLVQDHGVPQPGIPPIPYVIVTSRALRPAFLELGRERIRNGIRSAVRSLESLQSAYPSAVDDPDRIRQFLRDAYDIWGTRYVLLGGDSDVLPPRYVTTINVLGERHFVSDWYFACLDGTWDADGDGRYGEAPTYGQPPDPGDQPDLVPELYLGRAPVSTPAEARRFVDKTIAYERRPADGFENTSMMFANVLFPSAGLDFAQLAEQILPLITDDPSQVVTRLYESFDNPAWVPGALPENRAAVIDALNHGANMVIGFGGGSPTLMDAGNRFDPNQLLTAADVLGLTNGDRVGHVWLCTSYVGAFDTPTSLGEAFLRAERGGAVTVIAPSELEFSNPIALLTRRFAEVVYDEGAATIGEALVRARQSIVPFGDPIPAMSYHLLGDPMLRIFHVSPVAAANGGGAHGRTGITSRAPSRDEARAADVALALAVGDAAPPETRSAGAPATGFALAAPVPSPCVSEARISCTVPSELAGMALNAAVVDLSGRAVRTLARQDARAGTMTLDWDLRDAQGRRVPPGVYFVRAMAGGIARTRRLVVTGGR
jgi:hypothetical protein